MSILALFVPLAVATLASAAPAPASPQPPAPRGFSSKDDFPRPPSAFVAVFAVIAAVVGIGIIGGLIWKFVACSTAADVANRRTDVYAAQVNNSYNRAREVYGQTYGLPPYDVRMPPPSYPGRKHHRHNMGMHAAAYNAHMSAHDTAHSHAVHQATH